DDLDAERLRVAIELVAHLHHQRLAAVAHRVGERRWPRHSAQGRIQKNRKPRIGALRTAGLIKPERIGDAVKREGVGPQQPASRSPACATPALALSWLEAITSCAGDSIARMRLSI